MSTLLDNSNYKLFIKSSKMRDTTPWFSAYKYRGKNLRNCSKYNHPGILSFTQSAPHPICGFGHSLNPGNFLAPFIKYAFTFSACVKERLKKFSYLLRFRYQLTRKCSVSAVSGELINFNSFVEIINRIKWDPSFIKWVSGKSLF